MKVETYKKLKNGLYEVTINQTKYKLYDEVILKNNLLLTKEIDLITLEKILNDNEEYKAYYLALKYLGIKLRTEKEIITYLIKKEITEQVIDKTIKKLKTNNLLDKKIYLTSYINDQINLTLNGPNKIINDLIKLGFEEEEILNYLDINDQIWAEKVNKIIAKKLKSNHKLSNNEFKKKIKKDLYMLGYQDNIKELIAEINFDDTEMFLSQADKYYDKLKKKHKEPNSLAYAFKNKMYLLGYSLELIENYLNKKSE